MTARISHYGYSGSTGQKCLHSGWYRSRCHWHEDEIPMKANNTFPMCNQKHSWEPGPEGNEVSHGATWEWVRHL